MRGNRIMIFYSGNYSHQANGSSKQGKSKQSISFVLVGPKSVGLNVTYSLMTNSFKSLIKEKFGAIWNSDTKLWEIDLEFYQSCMSQVTQFMRVEKKKEPIYKIPQFVFNAQEEMPLILEIKNSPYTVVSSIKYNQLQTEIEPRALPFYYKLYDFQKVSLQFGIKRHGRLLLADEMGVGKTIQSIAIVSIYRHQWPFLVICPSSLRLNWQQEIINWLSDYLKKSQIQVYNKGGTPIRQNTKVLIVSYDMAWRIKQMLEPFQVVIADEAHYLKNSGNKRSDNLMPYLSSRKRVILLTGTPALAKPRQIFNLVSIVRPDVFTNFKQFGYRYCDPTLNPWSRSLEFNGCQNSKQLHYLISNKLMIRRLKKDVLTQLPDKQRQKVCVQTDKTIIKQIKELLNSSTGGDNNANFQNMIMQMFHYSFDKQSPTGEDTRQAISQAYTLTGRAKLQSVKEYILDMLNNDIKLIVFAHHMVMLDGLQHAMKDKKYKYIRIDGSVSKERRHESVMNFQDDSTIKVALLSITAAGVGLTLTAASTVVFAELHWTPGMMVQAEDRAHRIGQKSSVNCHYLIGQHTLDDILYRNLQKKVSNVSSFVEGKSQVLQIQKLSKGLKGKVSSPNENSNSNPRQSTLLFKFESIKPLVDKYNETSQSDISLVATDFNKQSDIDDISSRFCMSQKRKQVKLIQEHSTILQIETNKKGYRDDSEDEEIKKQKIEQTKFEKEDQLSYRQSSQLCNFILENSNQLLTHSQDLSSSSDTQTL